MGLCIDEFQRAERQLRRNPVSMVNGCSECLKKQQKIDKLTEQVLSLKAKLRIRQRRKSEGFFGSETPSSKVPIKPNTPRKNKKRGAKQGHCGHGRRAFDESDAEQVIDLEPEVGELCPDCKVALADEVTDSRSVMESSPVRAKRVLYLLHEKRCPECNRVFKGRGPRVLPRSLFGNQLITNAAIMHYLHGIPMGRICEQIGIGPGSLVQVFHRLARLFSSIPDKLTEEYRKAPVKHADETGWRTAGKNGYAWLFATPDTSIFHFKKTRSSKVPRAVFGSRKLAGVLVVDRYNGYNKTPCKIQYCYSHLLREVQNLAKEFPDNEEVDTFVSTVAPLLSQAMGLRGQKLSDKRFYKKASNLKEQIKKAMESPAQHLGIRRIQDIFVENEERLYHWADNRSVPAENNLAERDLRPTVIARKVSFGSQSDAGAHTRSVLMTVLNTIKKRGYDVAFHFKHVLDELAIDIEQDTFCLLFPKHPP